MRTGNEPVIIVTTMGNNLRGEALRIKFRIRWKKWKQPGPEEQGAQIRIDESSMSPHDSACKGKVYQLESHVGFEGSIERVEV